MVTAKATLSNFRQAPRKMRLVVNAVRGKKVDEALTNLGFMAKKASAPVKSLIESALANAKALDIPTENLIVKTIKVDGGKIMYRRMPAARGTAHPIRKRTSAIYVELGEKSEEKRIGKIKKEKVEAVVAKAKKSTIKKTTKKTLDSNI